MAVIQRPSEKKGFMPEKNRWQVERTFVWTNFSADYQRTAVSTVAKTSFVAIVLFWQD